MQVTRENSFDSEFCSFVYHGRPIAVLRRCDRWHVYLDHVLLHNLVFATSGHAWRWLIKRIDQQRARHDQAALAA
jgi:hypothetical protein